MNCNTFAASLPRRRSTITRVVALLVAATVSGVAGCSSDQSTGPGNGPVGSYMLRQVDEERIPAEIYHGPYFDPNDGHFYNQFIVEITGGSVKLNTDDTFSITFDVNMTGDGQELTATVRVYGTYETQGTEIWFEPDDETLGAGSGTLRSGTITLDMDLMGRGVPNQYSFRR